jgi:hypothetical protein
LTLDNYKEIELPVVLNKKEHIKYNGGDEIIIYNSTWQEKKRMPVDQNVWVLKTGPHQLDFDCTFLKTGEKAVNMEIRIEGTKELIKAR